MAIRVQCRECGTEFRTEGRGDRPPRCPACGARVRDWGESEGSGRLVLIIVLSVVGVGLVLCAGCFGVLGYVIYNLQVQAEQAARERGPGAVPPWRPQGPGPNPVAPPPIKKQ